MSEELEELKARYARLELLYQVGNVIHSTLEPQEALQLIVQRSRAPDARSSGSWCSSIPRPVSWKSTPRKGCRHGDGSANCASAKASPAGSRARKTGPVGDVGMTRVTSAARRDVRSELAVPLEVIGEMRGVINVDSDREGRVQRG